MSEPAPTNRSLFGEILDWMMAPLLVLWPLGVGATYYFANSIADIPYDQELAARLDYVIQRVRVNGTDTFIDLPKGGVLEADELDTRFFQVRGPDGQPEGGDPALGAPPELEGKPSLPGTTWYRDEDFHGQDVRVAWRFVEAGRPDRLLAVQVAETRNRRDVLANEMVRSIILPQFMIIPLAAILVWVGLNQGLKPLNQLRDKIIARRPNDLSPIPEPETPEELRPLITAFNELLERLERNMKAQSRFIADAAHQMRTPIAGLKTQVQLARRQTEPQQIQYALEQISASAERSSRLIVQLLSLARAESSQQSAAKFEILDLAALIREVTAGWVPAALDKGIDLGYEGPERPVRVWGNPVLLREMTNNLVDNALRYTPSPGVVTVRVSDTPQPALEVEDTGIGIAPAERERIFEPFHRVLVSGVDGTGLGLAIVREIADSHQARVSVEARAPGPGSRFRVVFPVPPAEPTEIRENAASGP